MQDIPYGFTFDTYAALSQESAKWQHFFGNRLAFSLTGDRQEDVHRVRLTIDPEGDYWAWWYSPLSRYHANQISMVFSSAMLVEICFANGTKSEEDLGHGRVVRVRVERIPEPVSSNPPDDA